MSGPAGARLPQQWARCNECGGEVLFQCEVNAMDEVVVTHDENYCHGECDENVGSHYTLVDGHPPLGSQQ